MYFSLFDKLCKNEFSLDDIEKVQEELTQKLYDETTTHTDSNNTKAQA